MHLRHRKQALLPRVRTAHRYRLTGKSEKITCPDGIHVVRQCKSSFNSLLDSFVQPVDMQAQALRDRGIQHGSKQSRLARISFDPIHLCVNRNVQRRPLASADRRK